MTKLNSRKVDPTTPREIAQKKENYALRLMGVIGSWGQMGFNLIFLVLLLAIAGKTTAVAVLKPNGEVGQLTYSTTLERTPEEVKLFARKAMINLHSWLETTDDSEISISPKKKAGVTTPNAFLTIPTTVARYTLAIAAPVREEYTAQIVKTISSLRGGKEIETIYRVRSVANVTKKADQNISVDVIGDLEVYRQSQLINRKIWNRRLTLGVIPPTDASSVVNGLTKPTSIGNDVALATGQGLQILLMEEF